jgi:hypothetical protein
MEWRRLETRRASLSLSPALTCGNSNCTTSCQRAFLFPNHPHSYTLNACPFTLGIRPGGLRDWTQISSQLALTAAALAILQ